LIFIDLLCLGILLTDASWIRQFVVSHRNYKQDSVVSDEIQYDLLWKIGQIANGHESCPLLVESHMETNSNSC
jgi:glutamate--cysteine ligase catalytic subunit